MSGQQRFDPRAEIGIIPADAIEVSGPLGWIGPFHSFGDDGHHLRVIRGHQFVSWSRGLIPHASSGAAVRLGIPKTLSDYLTADASASRDRANAQRRSAVRREIPRA